MRIVRPQWQEDGGTDSRQSDRLWKKENRKHGRQRDTTSWQPFIELMRLQKRRKGKRMGVGGSCAIESALPKSAHLQQQTVMFKHTYCFRQEEKNVISARTWKKVYYRSKNATTSRYSRKQEHIKTFRRKKRRTFTVDDCARSQKTCRPTVERYLKRFTQFLTF